jgi:hypothetical protein
MTYSLNLLLANQIKWELWNGKKFVYENVSGHSARLEEKRLGSREGMTCCS